MKNGTGGKLCGLKWLGERAYGGRFSSDPKAHHVNKAGKFLYFEEKQLHKA